MEDPRCRCRKEARSPTRSVPRGSGVYAVDPDKERIAMIQKAHPALKTSIDRERGEFAIRLFGKVCTTAAIHHFSDQGMGVSEFARLLKPAGFLLIVDIYPQSERGGRSGPSRRAHAFASQVHEDGPARSDGQRPGWVQDAGRPEELFRLLSRLHQDGFLTVHHAGPRDGHSFLRTGKHS
ncbi:MAG: methyltransferase domain-containing protein [Nitrososphaerota archaeon]|nr:methyltransferase domain-containing protein [Nitrososphaerota archaeon]